MTVFLAPHFVYRPHASKVHYLFEKTEAKFFDVGFHSSWNIDPLVYNFSEVCCVCGYDTSVNARVLDMVGTLLLVSE